MRMQRLRKHRTRFHLLLFIGKVVAIWYLVLFSISFIAPSDTTANFTDFKEARGMISAGDIPDESAFTFTGKGNRNWDACDQMTLQTEIKNNGDGDMQKASTYDVYYIANGNPKKHGAKMELGNDEGTIPILEKDATFELTYHATEPGRYIFVAYQLDEGKTEVWSKEIKMNCNSGQKPNKKETSDKEKQDEQQHDEQTNETETEDMTSNDTDDKNSDNASESDSTEKNKDKTEPKGTTNEKTDSKEDEKPEKPTTTKDEDATINNNDDEEGENDEKE